MIMRCDDDFNIRCTLYLGQCEFHFDRALFSLVIPVSPEAPPEVGTMWGEVLVRAHPLKLSPAIA